MSITLYTVKSIKLNELEFIPNETIYVNASNIYKLDELGITTLPAAVKNIAGNLTVIQGEDVYLLTPPTLEEQVKSMNFERQEK